MQRHLTLAVAVCAILGAGCSSSGSSGTPAAQKVEWPAPADPLALTRAAGLVPQTSEHFEYHVHAHVDVFVNGQEVTVPAGLGINIDDPGVKTFDDIAGAKGYGGINPPCKTPCISPLHTHDVSGIIHTESPTTVDNTLGELFVEWDVRLDRKCVDRYCRPDTEIGIYVNGKRNTGDPRSIALSDRKEIAIVIGSPPEKIPATGDFSNL
jgi:hypothetical protein